MNLLTARPRAARGGGGGVRGRGRARTGRRWRSTRSTPVGVTCRVSYVVLRQSALVSKCCETAETIGHKYSISVLVLLSDLGVWGTGTYAE